MIVRLKETIEDSNKDQVEVMIDEVKDLLKSFRGRYSNICKQYKDLVDKGSDDQDYSKLLINISNLKKDLDK